MGGFCTFPQILWNKNLTPSSEYNVRSSFVGLFRVLFPPKSHVDTQQKTLSKRWRSSTIAERVPDRIKCPALASRSSIRAGHAGCI